MKKKILAALLLTMTLLSGCGNKDMWDTVYTYDRAIILLQDGTVVDGKVESWSDYEDGDQIQVTIDGTVYLVHSSNITLIQESE